MGIPSYFSHLIKEHSDIKKRSKLIHEILKKVYDPAIYEKKIKRL